MPRNGVVEDVNFRFEEAKGGLVSVALLIALAVALAGPATPAAAYTPVPDLSYDLDGSGDPALNRLDLYLPEGAAPGDLRPVVIYAHGGGWMIGDKTNRIADKARLFTDAGYVFASVNYRLSPDITGGNPTFAPDRLRFPTHPQDVGESIAWLGRNVVGYGGDPDGLVLLGHSAGAHLVSLVGSDPSYIEAFGASLRQVAGVVSLDAGAMDVVDSAAVRGANPTDNNYSIWNAFGTPEEEAANPTWLRASPFHWGDPTDPRSLMVTQSSKVLRIVDNQKMATALGQDPSTVLTVPLDHEGINAELGSPTDSTGETAAVMSFIAERIAARPVPALRIRKRPAKVVRVAPRVKRRKVVIAFSATDAAGTQCRVDGAKFKSCRSPWTKRLARGRHTFAVRALWPSGRPGVTRKVTFRIKAKRRVSRGRNG